MFEESFHVDLALREDQVRPQRGVLKEGPAPMTAYKTGTKNILLGGEMDGDEGKDVQRDAVYVKE